MVTAEDKTLSEFLAACERGGEDVTCAGSSRYFALSRRRYGSVDPECLRRLVADVAREEGISSAPLMFGTVREFLFLIGRSRLLLEDLTPGAA